MFHAIIQPNGVIAGYKSKQVPVDYRMILLDAQRSAGRVHVVSPTAGGLLDDLFRVKVDHLTNARFSDEQGTVDAFVKSLFRSKKEYPSLIAIAVQYIFFDSGHFSDYDGLPVIPTYGEVRVMEVFFGNEADAVLYSMEIGETRYLFRPPAREEFEC